MRGRGVLRTIYLKPPDRSVLCILILAGFFLAGACAGFRFSDFFGADSQAALTEYLSDFCAAMKSNAAEVSFLRTIWIYFAYVFTAFLLGLSPLGVVLVPVLSGVFGFGTMFTVACFVRAFSRSGIFPAMALLILRLIFTLACFLLVAAEALPQAVRIAQVTIGRGKRCEPVFQGNRYFILFALCALFLFFCACFERFLTPILFRFAMEIIS